MAKRKGPGGFPEHGQVYKPEDDEEDQNLENNEDDDDQDDDDDSGDDEGEDKNKKDPPKPPKESIEERLARLEGENATLKLALNRPPEQKVDKKEPEPEPDWEKLMYDDPKEYTKQLASKIRREVEGEVVGKYQKDQGEKEFWNEFYRENDDLVEDKDLVQATLSRNVNILGDLPVSQAKKKLADLTRERIMKYTGKKQKKDDEGTNRARVEGGQGPRTPAGKADDNKIVTLSDIIRQRRANRMKARSA